MEKFSISLKPITSINSLHQFPPFNSSFSYSVVPMKIIISVKELSIHFAKSLKNS